MKRLGRTVNNAIKMKVRVKISSLVINKSINSSVYHFHFSKNRSLFEIQLESRAKRTVFTMLKLVKIPKSGIGFDVFEREKEKKGEKTFGNVLIKKRRIIDGGDETAKSGIRRRSDDWCWIDSKWRICAIAQLPLYDD